MARIAGTAEQATAEDLADLEQAGQPAAISVISLWELAKLVHLGKRTLTVPLETWLEEIENHPLLRVLPLTARIVAESVPTSESAAGAGWR